MRTDASVFACVLRELRTGDTPVLSNVLQVGKHCRPWRAVNVVSCELDKQRPVGRSAALDLPVHTPAIAQAEQREPTIVRAK